MKAPHLSAAAGAAFIAAACLLAGHLYAARMERRSIHALAPRLFEQKTQGLALQRAAFEQADLLPFYGSSELTLGNPYHASALFRASPTGFTVFSVGRMGTTCLIWLQQMAALGPQLRGKKVAFSLSPGWFYRPVPRDWYSGTFSTLAAGELAFSSALTAAVKRGAAQRMLDFPETLDKDPLLAFAVRQLADGSWASRALYSAVWPLGKLRNAILRLQDDWATFSFLRGQRGLLSLAAPVHTATLDWPALRQSAEQETGRRTDNNPFGFDNRFWDTHAEEIRARQGTPSRHEFVEHIETNHQWTDLALLLQALRDLGARPLLLSMPINGTYYDDLGIPYAVRGRYYDKLAALARSYDVPLVDFADHDGDKYFNFDAGYHLSRKGWIYYDQALDAFYHDAPIPGAH
jgi:D-alanine transfer protein